MAVMRMWSWTWARARRTVRSPDGEQWSVHVARGNRWQGWARLNRLEDGVLRYVAMIEVVPLLIGMLANVGPALWRWTVHASSDRQDWLVAVRPADEFWGRATHNAILVEVFDGRPAAVARAEDLQRTIHQTGVPTYKATASDTTTQGS